MTAWTHFNSKCLTLRTFLWARVKTNSNLLSLFHKTKIKISMAPSTGCAKGRFLPNFRRTWRWTSKSFAKRTDRDPQTPSRSRRLKTWTPKTKTICPTRMPPERALGTRFPKLWQRRFPKMTRPFPKERFRQRTLEVWRRTKMQLFRRASRNLTRSSTVLKTTKSTTTTLSKTPTSLNYSTMETRATTTRARIKTWCRTSSGRSTRVTSGPPRSRTRAGWSAWEMWELSLARDLLRIEFKKNNYNQLAPIVNYYNRLEIKTLILSAF